MRCRLLTAVVVCAPLVLMGQQTTAPQSDKQILDTPGAVRFAAVERYQATSQAGGTIQLRLGSAASVRIVPTDRFSLPVVIDPTQAAPTAVAALSAALVWDTERLTLDSITPGTFGSLEVDERQATDGAVALSVFSTVGTTVVTTIATLHFRAADVPGGATVALIPTQIGDVGGATLLRQLVVRPVAACVAPPGNWGDANDDGQVNIIDAQQIARRAIALSVLRPAVVTSQGDVNADGTVDIIDAQQVARASIGLSASERIGAPVFVIPPVFSVLVGTLPGSVGIGEATTAVASPRASSGLPLDGCVPVTWSSSSPGIAAVDSTGVVRAVNEGSTTITATAGGASGSTTLTTINRATAVTDFTVIDGPEIATYPGVSTGQPVRIRATNEFGSGVAGVPVTVQVLGGDVRIGPVRSTRVVGSEAKQLTIPTDADGTVIVRIWGGLAAPDGGEVEISAPGQAPKILSVTTLVTRKNEHVCMADYWSLRCWGDNSRGQLGDGTTTSSSTPVVVTRGGVTLGSSSSVSQEGFGDHTCLTDVGGDAYCWGSNTAGQIGDSTYADRSVPTRVRTTLKFTKIVTGAEHSCALTAAGEIWCWGYNWAGQLGDGTFSNRRPIPVRVLAPTGVSFTDVSAGANHTCGGTASGTWYCWGLNAAGQLGDGTTMSAPVPVAVTGGTAFVQIAGGEAHSCGRTAAGSAFCWGSPALGSLGDGRVVGSQPQLTPAPVVNGSGFIYLYAGYYRSCAIKADFTTWCWGWNNGGQIGDGTRVSRATPTLIPFTGYALKMSGTSPASSGQTTCGLTNASQQVFCWGSNLSGKLGIGTDHGTPIPRPTLVPRAGATAGAASAVTPVDDTFGGVVSLPAGATSESGSGGLEILVRDALGQPVRNQPVTFSILSGGVRFGVGDTTVTSPTDSLGIARSGPVSAGSTLGLTSIRASVPVATPFGASGFARFVVVGRVVPPGGSLVKVAGDSVLVTGINAYNGVPIVVNVLGPDGAPIPGAQVQVATVSPSDGNLSGSNFFFAEADALGVVTLDASLWTLGSGETSTLLVSYQGAATVSFTRFRSNGDPSPSTSCELSAAGAAYCWGSGAAGALGDGTTTAASSPRAVSGGLLFTQLAEGVAPHRCGLVGTSAYCWGFNNAGQLGDGSRSNRSVPTLVAGGLAFSQIAVGGNTTCGLTTSGVLYCWGWSGTAGFGLGDALRGRTFALPVPIATPAPFTAVSLADDAVCGLTASGGLWCRGDALDGWNLDGTTVQRTTFTQALGGPWRALSANYLGVCAIAQTDDRVFCGGLDQSNLGALGTGIPTNGVQATLEPVASAERYASVYAFHFGACARTAAGDTDCWGNNNFGQTGVGRSGLVTAPTRIDGIRFASLRPMAFRTICGKVSSGYLYCWGQNSAGQLGIGSASDTQSSNIPVGVLNWPDGPSAGVATTMVASTTTYGFGTTGSAVSPAPAVIVRSRTGAAVAGVPVVFSLVSGQATLTTASTTTDANGRAAVGALLLGPTPGLVEVRAAAVGLPALTFRYTVAPPPGSLNSATNTTQYLSTFESYSRNPLTVLVLDADRQPMANYPVTYRVTTGNGTVGGGDAVVVETGRDGLASFTNWGTPASGQGGFTPGTYTLTASVAGLAPVTFTMVRVQNYGGRTSCRIASGSTYCWGGNTRGEAGTGSTTAVLAPAAVVGAPVFVDLAEGNHSFHHCGLTASGAAFCWGDNAMGELGNGTRTGSTTPVAVSGGLTFSRLFKGLSSTCGLTTGTSRLYCWGWTGHSRLGDGTVGDSRTVPTAANTNGLTFTAVALGLDATCGLTASGGVHCWSNSTAFIPGDGGLPRNRPSPTPIPNLVATRLTASDRSVCVVANAGRILCWGSDGTNYGQLGNGLSSIVSVPTAIALPSSITMKDVRFSSWTSACGLATAGQMFCWGYNNIGQLGDGSTFTQLTPTPVATTVSFTSILGAGAQDRTCGVTAGGALWCWGSAPLGNGSSTFSPVPVLVPLPSTVP
jgi:alpha-tubulin suppressor-like RCC1 family protein